MKVYWHQCGHGRGNLGDRLTPLLLDYFNVPTQWAHPQQARLFGIGSILQRVPADFNGVIWSSGLLEPTPNVKLSKARILGLRGQLTLNTINPPNPSQIPLGDGGLLCHLFAKPTRPRFKLGIIPHYADAHSPAVQQLAQLSPDLKVIDICQDLPQVIHAVSQCEGILSSSLHGLIIADALHRPNQWIEFEPGQVLGNGFKFQDYYSVFNQSPTQPTPCHTLHSLDDLLPLLQNYQRPGLDEIQSRLLQSLGELARDSRHWQLGQLPLTQREKKALNGKTIPEAQPLSQAKTTLTSNQQALGQFFIDCLHLLARLKEQRLAHRRIQLDTLSLLNGRPVLQDFGWAIPNASPTEDNNLFQRDLHAMAAVFEELNTFDTYKTAIHLMPQLEQESDGDILPTLIDLFQSAKEMTNTPTPSPDLQTTPPRTADQSPAPVPFIVGTGRCGTTLLRLMLDSHPDLAIPPETHFIPAAEEACRTSKNPAKTFVNTLQAHRTWPDFHLDPDALQHAVDQLDPFNLSDALRLFFHSYAKRFNKPRWGEKTPVYSSHMRLIQSLLPEARFIHLVRDGRDVSLSVKEVFFGPKATREAGQWWAHGIREAHYQARQLNHYLELRYEDLVLEPERHLKEICSFLDLPWNPNMLQYYKRSSSRLGELEQIKDGANADQRRNIHQWTHKPPQASRLQRWKKEMPEQDRAEFEAEAGAVLTEMGYELSTNTTPGAPPPVWMEQLDQASHQLRQLIPANQSFILVDQAQLGDLGLNGNRKSIPFPNQNGEYWGPPEDDESALAELERLRLQGASHLVIAWPAFWWLNHYPRFAEQLQSRFPRVIKTEQLIAFQLQPEKGTS